MSLDTAAVTSYVQDRWDAQIIPTLHDYIRIPNVSPAFDPDWADAGHMARATALLQAWCEDQTSDELAGASIELHELPGRTPLLLIDVPPTEPRPSDDEDLVLIYGHLDKQPPFEGWRTGFGPWEPVIHDGRLYGRGGADDGYATFSALSAISAVRAAGGRHARCLVLIEASEESGSPDLPAHLEALGDRLGTPSLVIGLDSGCGDWEHMWVTTSLRGLVNLVLRVDVLGEGVHSGNAGGVVPSSFRVLRNLLDRVEEAGSGAIIAPELTVDVPPRRANEAAATAKLLGDSVAQFPLVPGAHGCHPDPTDRILARTWQPALEVVGLGGAPSPEEAGNVLRPFTSAKLSFRLPPTADPQAALEALTDRLTTDPPYGVTVTLELEAAEAGWHAPEESPWLREALDGAASAAFGRSAMAMGEGGTIPFMGMLGRAFPQAEFVVTGVLGPESNAHGPNEFLHLPTAKRLTAAVAHVLDAHARRR